MQDYGLDEALEICRNTEDCSQCIFVQDDQCFTKVDSVDDCPFDWKELKKKRGEDNTEVE